eukprot:ANDGO_03437.mRNA.1 hypothetical protein
MPLHDKLARLKSSVRSSESSQTPSSHIVSSFPVSTNPGDFDGIFTSPVRPTPIRDAGSVPSPNCQHPSLVDGGGCVAGLDPSCSISSTQLYHACSLALKSMSDVQASSLLKHSDTRQMLVVGCSVKIPFLLCYVLSMQVYSEMELYRAHLLLVSTDALAKSQQCSLEEFKHLQPMEHCSTLTATLDREVVERRSDCKTGHFMVLQDLTVFSSTARSHEIVVCPRNVRTIIARSERS